MPFWKIEKVSIGELENYFQEHPLHPDSVLPITPERIKSYVRNPRARKEDVVLYFIKNDEKIIAFRTVWADEFVGTSETTRFGWCSGNWVAPEYRRQGLSMLLMKEMYVDWKRNLCFTNYAPESEAGYLKSGYFSYSIDREGRRFYNHINLYELFEGRHLSALKKVFLFNLNVVFQLISRIKKWVFSKYKLQDWTIDEVTDLTQAEINFPKNRFNRDGEIFRWIFNYPWLTAGETKNVNYPFSQNVHTFSYRIVNVSKGEDKGSLLLFDREGKIKVLYWKGNKDARLVLLKWLINYCYQTQCKTLSVIDEKLASSLHGMRTPFAHNKKLEMKIYATFNITRYKGKIYDGDGDYCFT